MNHLLIDFLITGSIALPLFFCNLIVLFQFRKFGLHTALLGFVFMLILDLLGWKLFPEAMRFHREEGMSPVQMGISGGCLMPIVYRFAHFINEREKAEREKGLG